MKYRIMSEIDQGVTGFGFRYDITGEWAAILEMKYRIMSEIDQAVVDFGVLCRF